MLHAGSDAKEHREDRHDEAWRKKHQRTNEARRRKGWNCYGLGYLTLLSAVHYFLVENMNVLPDADGEHRLGLGDDNEIIVLSGDESEEW